MILSRVSTASPPAPQRPLSATPEVDAPSLLDTASAPRALATAATTTPASSGTLPAPTATPANTVPRPAPPPLRPIFAEAARLGLLAAGATVAGPLGQVLSREAQADLLLLLQETEAHGLAFAHHPNPNNGWVNGTGVQTSEVVAQRILESHGQFTHRCLNVSIRPPDGVAVGYGDVPMRMARIGSLADLQAIEALAVRRDARLLPNDGLAHTLLSLEDMGQQFIIDMRRAGTSNDAGAWSRAVGAFGAWRALTVDDGWNDGASLFIGNAGEVRPFQTPEQIDEAAFLLLDKVLPNLDPEQAAAIRAVHRAAGPAVGLEAFRHVRGGGTLDERLTRVAALADSFDSAQRARARIDGPAFDAQLAVLAELAASERIFGVAGSLDRAMSDLTRVSTQPAIHGAPLEVARRLTTLHAAMGAREGGQTCLDVFDRLHAPALPWSADEALSRFVGAYTLGHDLDRALRAATEAPSDAPAVRVEREGQDVVIGGIRIPRRQDA